MDPFALPPAALLAVELHAPAIEARRRFERKLDSGKVPTVDEVYDLTLAETDSPDLAEASAREWAGALLRADHGMPQ